mmetsp:Transcript_62896/g.203838  ORF Transcript_62896/g.203838 Transcript_62896/m.203838 type:complete len:270 (+) Transcript_62896:310-1119(+)
MCCTFGPEKPCSCAFKGMGPARDGVPGTTFLRSALAATLSTALAASAWTTGTASVILAPGFATLATFWATGFATSAATTGATTTFLTSTFLAAGAGGATLAAATVLATGFATFLSSAFLATGAGGAALAAATVLATGFATSAALLATGAAATFLSSAFLATGAGGAALAASTALTSFASWAAFLAFLSSAFLATGAGGATSTLAASPVATTRSFRGCCSAVFASFACTCFAARRLRSASRSTLLAAAGRAINRRRAAHMMSRKRLPELR